MTRDECALYLRITCVILPATARATASREAGLAEMQHFLATAGLSKDAYRFTDGSGLSRGTLVSPAAITKLLAYMYKSSYRDLWMSLLPIAGVDGTSV